MPEIAGRTVTLTRAVRRDHEPQLPRRARPASATATSSGWPATTPTCSGISREVEHAATVAAAGVGVGPEVTAFIRPERLPRDAVHRRLAGLGRGRPPARDDPPGRRFDPPDPRRPGDPGPVHPAPDRRGVPGARAGPRRPDPAGVRARRRRSAGGSSSRSSPTRSSCGRATTTCSTRTSSTTATRIRIVDWEYAGMGDPFFDLGNFSVNHGLDAPTRTRSCWRPGTTAPVRPERLARLTLMRVVSDFREAMWGVLQQGISTLDVDFVAYAAQALRPAAGDGRDARVRAGPARGGRRLTAAPGAFRRVVLSSARGPSSTVVAGRPRLRRRPLACSSSLLVARRVRAAPPRSRPVAAPPTVGRPSRRPRPLAPRRPPASVVARGAPRAAIRSRPSSSAPGTSPTATGPRRDRSPRRRRRSSHRSRGPSSRPATTPTRTGRTSEFQDCYDPTWGAFKDRTLLPAPATTTTRRRAAPATSATSARGPGTPGDGWYSTTSAAWHVVVLNANCTLVRLRPRLAAGRVAQGRPGRPPGRVHAGDLAPAAVQLGRARQRPGGRAVLGRAVRGRRRPVVNGHDHDYERFAPQDPARPPRRRARHPRVRRRDRRRAAPAVRLRRPEPRDRRTPRPTACSSSASRARATTGGSCRWRARRSRTADRRPATEARRGRRPVTRPGPLRCSERGHQSSGGSGGPRAGGHHRRRRRWDEHRLPPRGARLDGRRPGRPGRADLGLDVPFGGLVGQLRSSVTLTRMMMYGATSTGGWPPRPASTRRGTRSARSGSRRPASGSRSSPPGRLGQDVRAAARADLGRRGAATGSR